MQNKVVLTIYGLLFLGLIFIVFNIKEAYKAIPINSQKEVTPPPYSNWREYTPNSKAFTVMFPIYPQNAQESAAIPNSDQKRRYDMFVSQELNNTIFMVSQITYPPDYKSFEAQGLLHEVVDELVQGQPNNQVKSMVDATYQNYPAVDFQITNKESSIAGKVFMKENIIYLLLYIAPNPDFNLNDYQHFIDSFKLT